LLTSTEEAEDAMQEVLAKLWKNNILNEYKTKPLVKATTSFSKLLSDQPSQVYIEFVYQ
jgi:hypothetical protein